MNCTMAGLLAHHQLPKLSQTHIHWVCDAIQPSYPLSSPSLPAFNHSQHQGLLKWAVFHIRWPKYWSFSFSISPSGEYSGLISSRIDWISFRVSFRIDLLVVQGTLKSFLQHHSSKASILQLVTLAMLISQWVLDQCLWLSSSPITFSSSFAMPARSCTHY